MGRYKLADDEALVIEGRSPDCVFWNLCLWNPYMCTYDYSHHRCTVTAGQVRYEPDGSWRVIVAAQDPGHPNWLTTAGPGPGLLWFRWFLPSGRRCVRRKARREGRGPSAVTRGRRREPCRAARPRG